MEKFNLEFLGKEMPSTASFSTLMRNVYTWMTIGLGLTALTAYLVAANPAIITAIYSSRILLWGLLIGELALVMYLSARIMQMSFSRAMFMFLAYAVINGVTLSSIFYIYAGSSIAQAFCVTAGTFAGMSLLGYTTRTDLSSFGRIMCMLLIGLLIATVVNIFAKSTGFAMLLNYIGVLIFVGLTAYDTQKIKEMLEVYSQAGITDQNNKIALMGSLSLYLDFINLFLYILRIFGDRK